MSSLGGRDDKAAELPALEWLPAHTDTAQSDATVEVERSGLRRGLLALVVVALLATTTALWRDRSAPMASHPVPVEQPAMPAMPAVPALPTAVTTVPLSVEASTQRRADLSVGSPAELAELSRLGVEFRAVVSSVDGEQMALLDVTRQGATSWSELPRLRSVRFDSSGRWMAGVTSSELRDSQVLWVADIDAAVLEPVALNVRSFAWHDRQPGRLAWNTSSAPTVLSTLDLGATAEPTELDVPASGAITAWGPWGFAMLTSGLRFRSTLLAGDGTPVAIDVPGRFVATLPEGVLFTGSDGPTLVNPVDGVRQPVPWIEGDGHVWGLAQVGDGAVAALIDRSGIGASAFRADLVVVRPGLSPQTVFSARDYSDLATIDGDALLFVEQQADDHTSGGLIHLYRSDGRRLAVPVPDLFASGEWVAAITALGTDGAPRPG